MNNNFLLQNQYKFTNQEYVNGKTVKIINSNKKTNLSTEFKLQISNCNDVGN